MVRRKSLAFQGISLSFSPPKKTRTVQGRVAEREFSLICFVIIPLPGVTDSVFFFKRSFCMNDTHLIVFVDFRGLRTVIFSSFVKATCFLGEGCNQNCQKQESRYLRALKSPKAPKNFKIFPGLPAKSVKQVSKGP